jgi:Mn2+/Fe2+ NRAMP family transporter
VVSGFLSESIRKGYQETPIVSYTSQEKATTGFTLDQAGGANLFLLHRFDCCGTKHYLCGTLDWQSVTEGFLDIRAPTVTHCLVTRVVNISPEMIIISAIGHNDMTIFLNI